MLLHKNHWCFLICSYSCKSHNRPRISRCWCYSPISIGIFYVLVREALSFLRLKNWSIVKTDSLVNRLRLQRAAPKRFRSVLYLFSLSVFIESVTFLILWTPIPSFFFTTHRVESRNVLRHEKALSRTFVIYGELSLEFSWRSRKQKQWSMPAWSRSVLHRSGLLWSTQVAVDGAFRNTIPSSDDRGRHFLSLFLQFLQRFSKAVRKLSASVLVNKKTSKPKSWPIKVQ